jgi:hypothetical protein
MGKVKSAFEIAMEKADKIGVLSSEEKELIKDEERVMSILSAFYKGTIDSNRLWQQLKGTRYEMLRTAQKSMIDTLSLGSATEELRIKKQGIVAIETLKPDPQTAVIEPILHEIEDLQREYETMKKQVAEDLKKQIEMHPQLRMKPVKTPDGKTVMQMSVSVDEAVKTRLAEYLSEHEKQYSQEFTGIIEELKEVI